MRYFRGAVAAMCFTFFCASPAHALLARVWVSGKGVDGPACGPVAAPCRSPQYAHDNIIAPGGEIDIADPAGYGALNITKSLSVVNDGVGTAGFLQSNGALPAIGINAPGAVVHLRGLNIEGLGTGGAGVGLQAGASLTIINCVIRHFSGPGVAIAPSSGTTSLSITGSDVSDNGSTGVSIAPTGSGVVKGVVKNVNATNNGNHGFDIFSNGASASVDIALFSVVASNNKQGGLLVDQPGGGTASAQVRDSAANNNVNGGFSVLHGTLRIAHTVATGNAGPAAGFFAAAPGVGRSYGDNDVNGNAGGDVVGFTSIALQ